LGALTALRNKSEGAGLSFDHGGEKPMRVILRAALLLAAIALLAVPAAAQQPIYYPWCSVYGGSAGGGTNCGFSTIEQCRENVSGIGGYCEANRFYHQPVQRPAPSKRQRN
jgi:hypothetical protein